jgi:putative transposase
MPLRIVPLVNNCYYHIYNRGSNKQPIFLTPSDFKQAINTFAYYSISDPPLRYSHFKEVNAKEKEQILQIKNIKLANILCYCLMPNHFHILLRQNSNDGIQKMLRKFQISYTKYFNTKYNRIGPILQGPFKAVRIEDDYQLIHVSRYIHLNSYSSFIVKNVKGIDNYKWSSWSEYNYKIKKICDTKEILSHFKNRKGYRRFVFDNADYQRELNTIKHLLIENV